MHLPAYLQYLAQERRYSPHTVNAARRDLTLLLDEKDNLDSHTCRSRLARLSAQGLAPRSIARIASSWRGYFKYLLGLGLINADPMAGIKTPKRPRLLPKALSPEQADSLFSDHAHAPDKASDPQTMCLAELLYGAGLRISEAVGLNLRPLNGQVQGTGWIDLAEREVHVLGKGRKQRTVPVTQAACLAIERWLPVRAQRAGAEEPALFVSLRGGRLSIRTAQKMLAQLGLAQGLAQHLHPHMLRHSFASHVLQSSGDLRGVQELLGHSSIASTQVYTALDFQHLAHVYDKAHPRAQKKINDSDN